MSIFMSRASRRQDETAAFAETDAAAARAAAMGAEDHLVAVLKKTARLAVRQRHRLLAARGDLQQATAALVLRTGARAGGHEVADLEVASVAGVMCDHLG